MKNFIFFLLFAGFVNAQTHRFIYEMKYRPDSTKSDLRTENMVLDINPGEVKFYPALVLEIDSANRKSGMRSMGWSDSLPYIVRKKGGFANAEFLMKDALYKVETKDEIRWRLHPETRSEGGYTLQKATADFGGRHWTAWFAKDLGFPEGPYKFRGLPGLIFEISDSGGNYHFRLAQSKNLPETFDSAPYIENFGGRKPVAISARQLEKVMLKIYSDPYFDWKQQMMQRPQSSFWINETKVENLEQFRELTINEQNRIRRENNPIEPDKAVHYPSK